jgi:translation initiation factor 2B subunit (eIF-2B alpha/beta/delta family)
MYNNIHNSDGQTLIIKQYDNIAPKYIDLVITDIG